MGSEHRTIKIVAIVFILLLIMAAIIGTILTLVRPHREAYVFPELEVWPRSGEFNVKDPLISYKSSDPGSWAIWTQSIDHFLTQYQNEGSEYPGSENRVQCTFGSGAAAGRVCAVPVDDFSPCVAANSYNYERGGPCVFLRLSNVLNWRPDPYKKSKDLPPFMPDYLKHHIKSVSGKPEASIVWVSCEGENPADVENIGPVQYIPRRGFPSYYYPFTNKEGYLSPLVAVLFERPKAGVLINVECKAWAKNIVHDRHERLGSVRFGLMVDRD